MDNLKLCTHDENVYRLQIMENNTGVVAILLWSRPGSRKVWGLNLASSIIGWVRDMGTVPIHKS